MSGLFGGGSKPEADPVKEATEANVAAEEKKVEEAEKKEIRKINAAKTARAGGGTKRLMSKSTGGTAKVGSSATGTGAPGTSLAADNAVAFDLMENNDLYGGKRNTKVRKKLGVRNPTRKPGLMNIYS